MRAFFNRLHLGGKDKDRDTSHTPKEKFPPLPSWPPQDPPKPPATSNSTPNSIASFKPLPELVSAQFASQLASRPLPPIEQSPSPPLPESRSTATLTPPKSTPPPAQQDSTSQESSTTSTSESAVRSARKANGSTGTSTTTDVQKKVAFISPPPTPANFERALPDAPTSGPAPTPVPLKTTVSRFQAVYGKEPRGSTSTGASSSKTDVTTVKQTSVKATSTRTASPYLQKSFDGPSAQSLRSGTPYSSMSNNTSGSKILAAASWSEVTEDDLVSNLGSRERTRQEVLFEIISSEDRYVQELVKMKDTFIDPLLHPYSMSAASAASTPNLDYDYYRSESPLESTEDLPPIAARFMSPTPSMNPPARLNRRTREEAADRAGRL
ncbi:hypothetical protein NLJ89_g10089 [Agrocybe chaxingu]|uniref:DH domain-containing protein n=1 Tax=Agrocybe chaxingu TaxID=84603 RepID=A0A9W8MSG4_9AGAR|nr:hypothetical protein NLJ89_g10089 [Agrocybe chaxingu]